jgi:hypothetical protein
MKRASNFNNFGPWGAGRSQYRGDLPRLPLLRGLCADGCKANLEDFRNG